MDRVNLTKSLIAQYGLNGRVLRTGPRTTTFRIESKILIVPYDRTAPVIAATPNVTGILDEYEFVEDAVRSVCMIGG